MNAILTSPNLLRQATSDWLLPAQKNKTVPKSITSENISSVYWLYGTAHEINKNCPKDALHVVFMTEQKYIRDKKGVNTV